MPYHYTINDIQEHTGLSINFLRRCLRDMKDIFDPHATRGNKNSIVFDDSALIVFDRIKQLKAQDGLTIPEIRKKLGYQPEKTDRDGSKTGGQTLPEDTSKHHQTEQDNLIKQLYERLLEEKDKTYQTQISALQSKLYLLTDGRDPEEVKKEEEEKRKKKKEILDRLEELEGRWFKGEERKKLIEELRRLS